MLLKLIQDQNRLIEQHRQDANKATTRIAQLTRQIISLQEEKQKTADKIPPVIHVNKNQATSSQGDTSASSSMGKKRERRDLQENDQGTDVDTYESLPLKKRNRRQKFRPDVATVMATLAAATSPIFAAQRQFNF